MTYVRTWDPGQPLGGSDADLLAVDIQDFRVDVQERINTMLGADGDMTDDPVIPLGYDLTSLKTAVDALNATNSATSGTSPAAATVTIADSGIGWYLVTSYAVDGGNGITQMVVQDATSQVAVCSVIATYWPSGVGRGTLTGLVYVSTAGHGIQATVDAGTINGLAIKKVA